jgi:diacylglycerol O-acyltransferase
MLEPLSGLDAGFLYMETPNLHMHTLKVAIVDASTVGGEVPFALFQRLLEKKIRHLPAFRQRVVEIPFGLGHPVWATDPEFDLSHHLRHRRLEAPGGRHQLEAAVSEIASTGLSRSRPLWEITMIDGLEGERIAFVCKIHHSMADGSAAVAMLLRVLQDPVLVEWPQVESLPGRSELLRHAAREALRRAFELPKLVVRTLTGLAAWSERAWKSSERRLPRPFNGPSMPFNSALTPDRSFRTTSVPLSDLKRVRSALGVTLNDVVLALCSGALRIHFARSGELPKRALIAGIPINTQPGEKGRIRGNHVGHLMTSLFTDIDDPVERIHAIHAITKEAKERQVALGLDVMERWFQFTPPKPYTSVVRMWSKHRFADRVPAPMNLVVSNVAGPAESLTIEGVELEALYSVGPILEGVGLNLTGWSYAGEMYLVALACPQHIPDLDRLCDELPVALEELMDACGLRASECRGSTSADVEERSQGSLPPS